MAALQRRMKQALNVVDAHTVQMCSDWDTLGPRIQPLDETAQHWSGSTVKAGMR